MATAAKITLEKLEDVLTRAFEDARSGRSSYDGYTSQQIIALGTVGQALVDVKKLRQEQQQQQQQQKPAK